MTAAERTKAKILDLAIRGKLVPQDASDEPAAKLLEHIKEEKAKLVKEGKRKKERPLPEITADEIPFEIPASWKWLRLRELGEFSGGHTPSLADSSNWENGTVLWVTSKDMKQKYISDTGCKVSDKGAKELHLLPVGTLIMVTRSGILRRTFPIALAAKPLTINQDQRALEFYENIGEFVYIVLKGFEQKILKEYRKTGTTVESIIWEKFVDLPIPIPPLAEQKRIVAKVDDLFSYADRISASGKAIKATAERIDRKILDLAIRGKLVPQDANDEPAAKLLERIKDKKAKLVKEGKRKKERPLPEITADEIPFDIPPSWKWVRLGEICSIEMGQAPDGRSINEKDGVEFHQGKICFTDKVIAKSIDRTTSPSKIAPANSVLLCVRAPVGKVNVVDREICIGRGLCAITPLCEMTVAFLFEWLKPFEAIFCRKATGSTFKAITKETVVNQVVPIPPLEEQKRIVAKVEELRALLKPLYREDLSHSHSL